MICNLPYTTVSLPGFLTKLYLRIIPCTVSVNGLLLIPVARWKKRIRHTASRIVIVVEAYLSVGFPPVLASPFRAGSRDLRRRCCSLIREGESSDRRCRYQRFL